MTYLSKRAKGENVRKMQTALNRAGYTCSADGIFGDETEQALIAFQLANRLRVDGICGEESWRALEPFMADFADLRKAIEKCLDAVEALPEYKALEDLLYG